MEIAGSLEKHCVLDYPMGFANVPAIALASCEFCLQHIYLSFPMVPLRLPAISTQ
jgi:hypothetical protein